MPPQYETLNICTTLILSCNLGSSQGDGLDGQGGQGVLLGKTTLNHPNNKKKTDLYN